MIDEGILECVEHLGKSESARSEYCILLATDEQIKYFSKLKKISNCKVIVVKGNEVIERFFYPDNSSLEPEKNTMYIIDSEPKEDLAKVMTRTQSWVRGNTRINSDLIIIMFNKDHFELSNYPHLENLRSSVFDMTKKLTRMRKLIILHA